MASYAWVLGVRPGYEDEYKKRHDEIWPEMLETLRHAGLKNYNIFRHGLTLFGYFECDDLEKAKTHLAKCPINAKWAESMSPIMVIDIDPATDFPYLLPLQFQMT
ncbi:MAG: L-rhamnose mutarotase [Alphaproteobacteria bacterium]|nr:L-rhamnose mutarotase [Alphaproteobacteria bacterium]